MTRTLVVAALLVFAAPLLGCGRGTNDHDGPGRVRLATTTSTDDSGLLAWCLTPFEDQTGIEVQIVAVGTGQALALGRGGDADIVLVHARTLEDAFVDDGHGVDRRDVMWNEFVIVGPPDDRAGVRGMADPADALKAIAAARALFISRGDGSGTHVRERALWSRAGVDPIAGDDWDDWYWQAGQGMGPSLSMADEKRGYVLTDRGTYLAWKAKVGLTVLVESHETLRNPYGLILVNPERHPHVASANARRLADYLTSPEGQQRIADFRVDGEVLFHPVVGE